MILSLPSLLNCEQYISVDYKRSSLRCFTIAAQTKAALIPDPKWKEAVREDFLEELTFELRAEELGAGKGKALLQISLVLIRSLEWKGEE